ncbi:MAG: Gfo/Idh/MocA family oxidoreductase [Opitutaceae bacterium]|nr:Gfo/Idh/MocA family oxidoreductase [Opitutaceae bacterium]
MKKVRWGVISTANIGINKVLPGMMKSEHCELLAMSSRDLRKAQKAARRLGIPKAYGSYEELLADPDIDAVYNPLPNHLHVDWSIKALEAGKHVLCEKPLGMNTQDARRLLDVMSRYPHLKVMEAFMYRFHPQWVAAKEWVDSGRIGELKTIQSFFSYYNDDPGNIRNMADIGGGGLLDIGCYCISLSRFLFGKEPNRVMGIVENDPVLKTDRMASGVMDFGEGTSNFTCSTQLSSYQSVQILGTKGRVEIEIPFNAPPDKETRIWIHSDKGTEEVTFPICDQYSLQGDVFSKAILEDTPVPTPLIDAIENMSVIDAIFESGKKSSWVVPVG